MGSYRGFHDKIISTFGDLGYWGPFSTVSAHRALPMAVVTNHAGAKSDRVARTAPPAASRFFLGLLRHRSPMQPPQSLLTSLQNSKAAAPTVPLRVRP